MVKPDLHIHSIHSSDGELTIAEIIDKAVATKIDLLSITDHNSVAGTEDAEMISTNKGLLFIPGIEIDCNFNGTDLHLLGYHINWRSNDFIELEKDIRKKVMVTLDEMIENINALGFGITSEEVIEEAGDKLPTGELIGEMLLAKGEENEKLIPYKPGGTRSDMPYLNFYLDYFAQGKPAYAYIKYMDFKDALELVRDNAGIPIVAHPGLNFKGKERTIEKLLEKGAHGLEAFNNYHNDDQIDYFCKIAQNTHRLITCGSDFHGKTKPTISLGSYHMSEKYKDYLFDSLQMLMKPGK